jgi:predicted PurR-regulated permease PerM
MPKKITPKNLVLPDISRYFLIVAVVGVTILLFWAISPFFSVLIYAVLLTVIFSPVYTFFIKLFRGHSSWAAFVSTILLAIIILLPLSLFFILVAQEAVDAYRSIQDQDISEYIAKIDLQKIDNLPFVNMNLEELISTVDLEQQFAVVQDILKNISSFLVVQSTSFLKSIGSNFIKLILLLLTVFFLFKDGATMRDFVKSLSPLPLKYEDEVERKLKNTIYAIVVGGFGSAIIQGIAGAIGFAIAGVEQVVFFGTLMAFGALIPYFGPSVIWGPVALGLMITGEFGSGLFLMIWGLVLVSTVDNFIKPILIGNRAHLYPLATFFVVLGGLFVFGLKGIIFGPLILSLALSIYHIYRLEYKEILKV